MRLVLLGAPGSGKGTQADLLKAEYGCLHISTGDILRQSLRDKTELGLKAEAYMKKGELVPDGLIINMLSDRLHKNDAKGGFMLDGFPRTIPQAESLDTLLGELKCSLDAVLLMKIDEEILVKRLTNRRTCRSCGKIWNLLAMKDKSGKCPDCGGELYQREDDEETVIRNRLKVYNQQTMPLVSWYEKKDLLRSVDATKTQQEIFKEIQAVLGKHK